MKQDTYGADPIRWDRRFFSERRRLQQHITFPDRRTAQRRQTSLNAFLWHSRCSR